MKYSIAACALVIFIGLPSNIKAQTGKGCWEIGIHGAPLFKSQTVKVSGGLITINTDYFISDKLSAGFAPYYGFTGNEGHSGYNLMTMEPVGYSKTGYNSFGANLNLKFFLLKSSAARPYITILGGLGRTYYSFYSETEGKYRVYEKNTDYETFNLGTGIGARFRIVKSIHADAKIMYAGIAGFDHPSPTMFLYPSLGFIKSL
ncbi:MAG: hypothetical protein MI975_02730 [Cytophagales bacterium]|nr:hypothetical protein [Cytophagales bacterium]